MGSATYLTLWEGKHTSVVGEMWEVSTNPLLGESLPFLFLQPQQSYFYMCSHNLY